MAFHEALFSLFGTNSIAIFGGIGGIALILLLIWLASRNRSMSLGAYSEVHPLKGSGYITLGLGYSGVGLLRLLRSGIKGSIKLGKMGWKAGKKGGELAKDASKQVRALIKGEERNLEEELHQTSAAAASYELAREFEELSDVEIRIEQSKKEADLYLEELDDYLSSLSKFEDIDKHVRDYIVWVVNGMYKVNFRLVNYEELEVKIRRAHFEKTYQLLKVIKVAETLARRIEARAIVNEKSLNKFNNIEIVDLEKYLNNKIREENDKIKAARQAYNVSTNADRETRTVLYNQIKLAQESAKKIKENIERLIEILNQLKTITWRMLNTLRKIRNDIKEVTKVVSESISVYKKLESAEKDIEKMSKALRLSSKKATANFESIQQKTTEEIIINLTSDISLIFTYLIRISEKIQNTDEKILIPFLQNLQNAMQNAYKVEEASRIAHSFYAKLMNANQQFYQLVIESDLSQEVKDTFTAEIQIEKMEEQIAERQKSVAQAAKSLFIKTMNTIQNTISKIAIFLETNKIQIQQTVALKDNTLNFLEALMEKLVRHKVRANSQFAQEAEEYKRQLQQLRSTENLVKLAA